MTDEHLNRIRGYIACPQLGDKHYGEWGILRLDQRKEIYALLVEIKQQNAEIDRLNSDLDSLSKTVQNLLLTVSKTKKSTIEEFMEKLEAKLQRRALFSVIDTIHEVAAEMGVDIE